MRILLTGASGFVGRAVLARLQTDAQYQVRCALRQLPAVGWPADADIEAQQCPDLSADADWQPLLAGVDGVIHCAARVHVMHEQAADPLAEFRRVNVQGTLRLAQQAAQAGVKRFVFVSSVKVNGEQTAPGQAFSADDSPQPSDPYGISKLEAEQALLALAQQTGLEVVIVRPPLVYGPGVKANFLSMMRWLRRGVPLPLGAINNRRSLVAVANLADLLVHCLQHPQAANQRFMVSDGADLSTAELLRKLAHSLGAPSRLVPVPSRWLAAVAALLGAASIAQRLCGSLQVDIEKTRQRLQWSPPLSTEQALARTAEDFLQS
ncbi:UDP-glucose 4-epimerase [Atopomonas hussainii]|uniref:UDP-glucose 4-epimerase n=1 Tax=Atopomonas hussainii TaxID=1429083 RepID=A0A1H7NZ02_9GAMM|nr:SDR family oxidoreductase [Atopomonas hussainii]SEL28559.1 UDP-glucose 4-epimerase [Atopomonas hussainii]